MTISFQEHPVQWTRDLSSRFWDFKAHTRAPYFSDQWGPAVLRATRRAGVPLRGRVLDFGCGPGHLMHHMIGQKISCEGADFSADSVQETNRRFAGNPHFKGATEIRSIPTHLAADLYDVVFCIETVEHILPSELKPTFVELHRILKPGGYLIVTTPNDENLSAQQTMCPECGSVFHLMQHVNTWNAASLTALINPLGFRTVHCGAAHFDKGKAWERLRSIVARVRREKMPNLVYVGQKVSA
jgi:2-polyprenyl-3-methyl-5-hydroxy-6-metoxy-1,4-benzoquinol methylase